MRLLLVSDGDKSHRKHLLCRSSSVSYFTQPAVYNNDVMK